MRSTTYGTCHGRCHGSTYGTTYGRCNGKPIAKSDPDPDPDPDPRLEALVSHLLVLGWNQVQIVTSVTREPRDGLDLEASP